MKKLLAASLFALLAMSGSANAILYYYDYPTYYNGYYNSGYYTYPGYYYNTYPGYYGYPGTSFNVSPGFGITLGF